MRKIISLYCDGGVIASNPSAIGGTYAYKLIFEDGTERGQAAVLTPDLAGGTVTNNQTEMLALLKGLVELPADFNGTIYSDSQVTLGRVFHGWQWKNIPAWICKLYQEQRARFTDWDAIGCVLLDGHPTRKQLQNGIGKRGNPVSEHNVWCDQACKEAGESYLATVESNISSTMEVSV